jgi:hypothetical protein
MTSSILVPLRGRLWGAGSEGGRVAVDWGRGGGGGGVVERAFSCLLQNFFNSESRLARSSSSRPVLCLEIHDDISSYEDDILSNVLFT